MTRSPSSTSHSYGPAWAISGSTFMTISSRDQDRAALHLAVVQVMKRLVGLLQPVFAGGELDQAPVGQRHQFDQFGISANQVADDGLFRRDHFDRRDFALTAIADDVVETGVPRH